MSKKTKEVDFGIIDQSKASAKQALSLMVKHDKRGLFVWANIVLYFIIALLGIFRLFGLI